jgi:3-phenylpropionate/trans-cinnamate dioxygenase ferredoxin component
MAEVWVPVCKVNEIEEEDVRRFDHDGRTFAVYRLTGQKFHATEGLCTHGKVHLSGGMVMGTIIECPKHNGRFDVTTGKAKGAPACIDLKTYPVKVEGEVVSVRVE